MNQGTLRPLPLQNLSAGCNVEEIVRMSAERKVGSELTPSPMRMVNSTVSRCMPWMVDAGSKALSSGVSEGRVRRPHDAMTGDDGGCAADLTVGLPRILAHRAPLPSYASRGPFLSRVGGWGRRGRRTTSPGTQCQDRGWVHQMDHEWWRGRQGWGGDDCEANWKGRWPILSVVKDDT